jgi:hypothetical protein
LRMAFQSWRARTQVPFFGRKLNFAADASSPSFFQHRGARSRLLAVLASMGASTQETLHLLLSSWIFFIYLLHHELCDAKAKQQMVLSRTQVAWHIWNLRSAN